MNDAMTGMMAEKYGDWLYFSDEETEFVYDIYNTLSEIDGVSKNGFRKIHYILEACFDSMNLWEPRWRTIEKFADLWFTDVEKFFAATEEQQGMIVAWMMSQEGQDVTGYFEEWFTMDDGLFDTFDEDNSGALSFDETRSMFDYLRPLMVEEVGWWFNYSFAEMHEFYNAMDHLSQCTDGITKEDFHKSSKIQRIFDDVMTPYDVTDEDIANFTPVFDAWMAKYNALPADSETRALVE